MRVLRVAVLICVMAGSMRAAGERTNIRGMGMARTFTATSRGLDAVGINPAMLALDDGTVFSLSLPTLGFHAGSDVVDYDLYTRYFTGVDTDNGRIGRFLTDEDKDAILARFNTSEGSTIGEVDARLIGVSLRLESMGAFAFTVTDHVAASVSLPQDYVKFVLYGNPVGTSFDFSATHLEAAWTREYALSYAGAIPGSVPGFKWFAAGVSAKIVHGFAYFKLERFNTSLTTSDDGILTGRVGMLARTSSSDMFNKGKDVGFSPFPSPVGQGLGFDVGIAAGINEYISVGASVTDIGAIRWSKNTQEYYADTTVVVDDPFDPAQRSAIESLVAGKRREAGGFSTALPTMLRLGVAVDVHQVPGFTDMPGELVIGFDYNQGLRKAPASFIRPRFSLGVEYVPLVWLPIRTGISFGGTDHANFALGVGFNLGFFSLDLASENIVWLLSPASSSYGSIAAGITLKF